MGTTILTLVGLALGTVVQEDVTLLGAGLLARFGDITVLQAVLACGLGIFVSDLGLWFVGRKLGRRALRHRWLAARVQASEVERIGPWLDRRLGMTVLLSRCVPGSRLPLYLAAGIWSKRPAAFALWTLLSVAVWTPTFVILTARYGERFARPFQRIVGEGWPSYIALLVVLVFGLRLLGRFARSRLQPPTG
ncbi:MAG: hypothetical protein HOP14_05635 [Acidobacteria bacterium]|nr:hypothetical protein [Acidobacteriota bacterium]